MHFALDRCLQCRSPNRPDDLEEFAYLDATGKFLNTEYWFCSMDCFTEAVKQYTPAKYRHERPIDDPELRKNYNELDRKFNQLIPSAYGFKDKADNIVFHMDVKLTKWKLEQKAAIDKALEKLSTRILSEYLEHIQKIKQQQAANQEMERQRIEALKRR